ncbi:MAG TPA: hypothetical protein DCY37_07225 [Acidaminococcaceae bacterium]|nr:hypothetical protein [Acidaminococcaceae bacterium]
MNGYRDGEDLFAILRKEYEPEPIRRRRPRTVLPALLHSLRELEAAPAAYESRSKLFYEQARLAEQYEDEATFKGKCQYFAPTYGDLSDEELQGYFGWRTRLRQGRWETAPDAFIFLYVLELLNGIGTVSPEDGYGKLEAVAAHYGPEDSGLQHSLRAWMRDYRIYYNLPPAGAGQDALPEGEDGTSSDSFFQVLLHGREAADGDLFAALNRFSSYRLDNSRLYKADPAFCTALMAEFCRQLQASYGTLCPGRNLLEDYVLEKDSEPIRLFRNSRFWFRPDGRSFTVRLGPYDRYEDDHGQWSRIRYLFSPVRQRRLGDLLKSVDALARRQRNLPAIRQPLEEPWLAPLFQQTLAALSRKETEARRRSVRIDFSRLSGIRSDAAVTGEKLMTDEERWQGEPEAAAAPETEAADEPETVPDEAAPPVKEAEEPSAEAAAGELPAGLTPDEYHLVQCLLYDRDWHWAEAGGRMVSLLVDAINGKLYDEIGDAVLTEGDGPELVPDYIDDLKGLIQP